MPSGDESTRFRDPAQDLSPFLDHILVGCPRCDAQASVVLAPDQQLDWASALCGDRVFAHRRLVCPACSYARAWLARPGPPGFDGVKAGIPTSVDQTLLRPRTVGVEQGPSAPYAQLPRRSASRAWMCPADVWRPLGDSNAPRGPAQVDEGGEPPAGPRSSHGRPPGGSRVTRPRRADCRLAGQVVEAAGDRI